MDMRWDNGFISSEHEYMKKRIELQHELEQLTPIGDDELEQTANILESFAEHWQRLEGDEDGKHELVKLIVDRVYVEEETVVAMTLKSNYHLVLGHNAKEPTEHSVDPYAVPKTVQVRERRDSLTHVYNIRPNISTQTYCFNRINRYKLLSITDFLPSAKLQMHSVVRQ
jgi:hypothetical protein